MSNRFATRFVAASRRTPSVLVAILWVLAMLQAASAGAAEPAAQPSPAFRAAIKRFLIAQRAPEQMGEQMSFSAAEQVLAPLASRGVSITEPMQAIVLEEARKDFGKRFGDVEYLADLYSEIYSPHFTEKEIAELATFWESPVARKLFDKTGTLNQNMFEKIQSSTTGMMKEFQTRIDKRLREAGILGDAPEP